MGGSGTFAAEKDGEVPELGHVECFEDLALVAGAVSVEANGGVAVVFVLIGKCNAGADRYLSTDYAIAAVEPFCKHVHGSTFSVGNTFSSAKQLADDGFDRSTAHESKAVTSVSGNDVVLFGYGVLNACCNCFLASGKMAETSYLLLFVQSIRGHLHPSAGTQSQQRLIGNQRQ